MGRARQIASAENMDRILLDASAASTDEGEHILLDSSDGTSDAGFFITTEVGTTETPPEGFVNTSSIAADAITNAKIANDAVKRENVDNITDISANRNVIINGAMNVSQRQTSVTGIGASSGYFTLDRFQITAENTNGRLTMTQTAVTDLPGFANCLKLDCTTADTSIAAGEDLILSTSLEGQDLQHFKKGTSEARGWAVSFYVKGDTNSTYACELLDGDNSRHIVSLFDVTNNWSRVKINFPADTTGALDDDTAASIVFNLWLHAGSTYNGGTLQTTWASKSNANRAVGADSFFASTDRNFFITGVQMEAGDSCTDFQYEHFDVTLRKCNRYFENIGYTAGSYVYAAAYAYNTTEIRAVQHYLKKRATPSFTFDAQGDLIVYYNGDSTDTPNWNYHDIGLNSCRVSITLTGVSTTGGYGVAVYVNGSDTYNVKVDAEL